MELMPRAEATTTILPLMFFCLHCASNRSHQEEVALQVDAEQLVPLLGSNVNSVHTGQCDAGGSYEDVDLAEVFLCNLNYVVDGLLAGYVACNANSLGALEPSALQQPRGNLPQVRQR